MEGCGWCDKFKPTWDQFTTKYAASLAANKVAVKRVESKDDEAYKYKDDVKGYPTVLFIKPPGAAVKFGGERTEARTASTWRR